MKIDAELAPLLERNEEEAALYAVGSLPPERMRAFAQRLEAGCDLCRHQAARHEESFVMAVRSMAQAPPEALTARMLTALDGADLAETETPAGIHVQPLGERDGTWRSFLLRIDAGATYPEHDHVWREQCVVLEGEFERAGKRLQAGDVEVFAAGSTHEPVHSAKGCLLLVVQTAVPGFGDPALQ
jgi:anti-sigma factor ChrR (cupin superfamily)